MGVSQLKRKKCYCPVYCKYCGAKLKRDWIGHICPTKNCQWEHGADGCCQREQQKTGRSAKEAGGADE